MLSLYRNIRALNWLLKDYFMDLLFRSPIPVTQIVPDCNNLEKYQTEDKPKKESIISQTEADPSIR